MICYIIYTLLLEYLPLLVLSEVLYPNSTSLLSLPTGQPFARCDGLGVCEMGDGSVVLGETMEKYLFPHAIWIRSNGVFYNSADPTSAGNFTNPLQLQIGDIVIPEEDFKPQLRSAILDTFVYRWMETLYYRRIVQAAGTLDRDLGYVIVEPPVPNPDGLFESLAQNPLLAAVPTRWRSVVDPALIIPAPTFGCQPNKCFQFIGVSNQISQHGLLSLLTPIPSADVFYFGPDPTNTACLRDIISSPPLPTRPPIPMYSFVPY